jgi:aminoglycoside phosphotransferase (APT) family kinase protein
LVTGSRRPTWGQKAPHYAEVIAGVLPAMADRARRIAAAVDHDTPEGPDVPIHGDFYESQLMVAGGEVTGLLDIDTAGLGERLDDAACLLAHLSVLAQICPARAGEINELGSRLERRLSQDLDRAALARRTAAVVLSLATGPHRVQEPGWPQHTEQRIALAERWIEFAVATVDGPL